MMTEPRPIDFPSLLRYAAAKGVRLNIDTDPLHWPCGTTRVEVTGRGGVAQIRAYSPTEMAVTTYPGLVNSITAMVDNVARYAER